MKQVSVRIWLAVAAAALIASGCGGGGGGGGGNAGQVGGGQQRLAQSSSSPIAISPDSAFVWSVNPDNDSVSVMEVKGDKNQKIADVAVGDEPRCVALTPDYKKAYVSNAVSGSVTVVDAAKYNVLKTISVGAEPFGCALTLDGAKLYVANLSSNSVSVIDTASDAVAKTIDNVGEKPRGVAVAEVGGQTKVYVTQFLAQLVSDARAIDQKEGRDDGREGRVTVINAATDTVAKTIKLKAQATGFKSDGSTLDKIAFDANNDTTKIDTLAFPNQLESIVVRGNRAYVPNTASSPNGPVKFNVNMHAFISVIDTGADQEVADETFNMNKGVQFEAVGKKLFPTNPAAMAFKHSEAFEGFTLSRATDRLVRVVLDANNKPTINAPKDANDPGNVIRVEVGVDSGEFHNSGPEGVVINGDDTRAYVMNLTSRDVSVMDISGADPARYKEIARIESAALPTDPFEKQVHRGKELFNTSIGPAGTNDNAKAPAGRMSDFGWGSCYGCHPRGLADGVTWMFGDGPRQTVSMESTAAHPQVPLLNSNANGNFAPLTPAFHQRALNWSAARAEIQAFELNTRNVSGGQGLIALPDATQPDGRGAPDPCVFNLVLPDPNPNNCAVATTILTGRDKDWDAIAAYIAFGVRAPVSPLAGSADPEIGEGRNLFAAANCQGCHGGANWTASTLDIAPPVAIADVTAGQLNRFLCKAGTFDAALANELKATQNVPQGAPVPSLGALGINIPSLLTVFASAPYFHSGAATTLDAVLENVDHRKLGTGADTLSNAADRAKVVKFLKSINLNTPAFPEKTIAEARALCLP
jgi:YVTN family beta-propeller protein